MEAAVNIRSSELDLSDTRQFSLVDYRHGHSYVVIRGFPPMDDKATGGGTHRVLDLFFTGIDRIACGRDLDNLRLRRASDVERIVIMERIGRIKTGAEIYFLESGSVESYVIAQRVYWAEFDLPYGAVSPLAAEERDYREAHPPIGGIVRYAD